MEQYYVIGRCRVNVWEEAEGDNIEFNFTNICSSPISAVINIPPSKNHS